MTFDLIDEKLIQESFTSHLYAIKNAFNQKNFTLYRKLLEPFFPDPSIQNPAFKLSYYELLQSFISAHYADIYNKGFDFILINDTEYETLHSGSTVAIFNTVDGLEVKIDEKIEHYSLIHENIEGLKIEIAKLELSLADWRYLILNPQDIFKQEFDYLISTNPFNADQKKDLLKIIKQKDLLMLYLKYLEDSISTKNDLLNHLKSNVSSLNEFTYTINHFIYVKDLFFQLVYEYSLVEKSD